MNEEIRKAIQHIISYCWQDEMNDYLEQDEEGQRNHVFCDMVLLDEWLNRPACAHRGDTGGCRGR
jgi:hypothetical protein